MFLSLKPLNEKKLSDRTKKTKKQKKTQIC